MGRGWQGICPECGKQSPCQVTRCIHTGEGQGHNCGESAQVTFRKTDQIKYILSTGQRSHKYEKGKNYNELCDAGLELELSL